MTSLVNSVRLIGNVGQLPQIKTINNGSKIAQVSLATSQNYVDKTGKKIAITNWHLLTFWGKKADLIETYVNKGDKLMIEGKLKYSSYTDNEGIVRNKTEIEVNEFKFLGSPVNTSFTENKVIKDTKTKRTTKSKTPF